MNKKEQSVFIAALLILSAGIAFAVKYFFKI